MKTLLEYINLIEKTTIVNDMKIFINPMKSQFDSIFNNSYLIKHWNTLPALFREIYQAIGSDDPETLSPETIKILRNDFGVTKDEYLEMTYDAFQDLGHIHADYTLRGIVGMDNTIYMVDAFYATHGDLYNSIQELDPTQKHKFSFTVSLNRTINVPPSYLHLAKELLSKYQFPINTDGYSSSK